MAWQWAKRKRAALTWAVIGAMWLGLVLAAVIQIGYGLEPWGWLGPVADLTFAAVLAGLTAQLLFIEKQRDEMDKASFVVEIHDVWLLDVNHAAVDFTVANAGHRDSAIDEAILFRGRGPESYAISHFSRFYLNEGNDMLIRSGEKGKFVLEFNIAPEDATPRGTLQVLAVFGDEGSSDVDLHARGGGGNVYERLAQKSARDNERKRYLPQK